VLKKDTPRLFGCFQLAFLSGGGPNLKRYLTELGWAL